MNRHKNTTGWLVRALQQEEAFQILAREGYNCGFMDGGCWMLAEALRRLLGGNLYAVYRDLEVMDHVVLRLGSEEYLDADGLHTYQGMLLKMREDEGVRGRLTLNPFIARLAREIPYSEKVVWRLKQYLRAVRPVSGPAATGRRPMSGAA